MRNSSAQVLALGVLMMFAGGLPAWAQPHAPLSNHGGPVLGNFEIYPLYYGNWNSADIAAQQNFLAGLTAYLSGADAPAGEQTMMQQYGVNGAAVAASKTASAPAGATGVSDDDLRKLIHANQASRNLPAYGANTLIMVFLASGMTASSASNGSCAYHSNEGGVNYYSVVPKDCALTLVTGHEVFEAAADPGVGSSNVGWDEPVDGCTSVINLWFGQIPGAADNSQGGTCSTTGYTGAFQYQGIAGPTQAVARVPGHLDVFWVGVDGSVQTNWWDASGQWSTHFAIAPAGSALPGTVSVAARAPGHLDVFWVAPNGAVMTNYWDASFRSGQWNAPFALTPPESAVASQVAAVGRTVDHLDIFWVGLDGSVWTDAWDLQVNNAQWVAPLQIGRKGSAVPGSVAAVTRMPGHLDVFWVAPDGSVTGFWWDANFNNGQWNGPEAVAWPNNALPGAITAVARRTDHLDVFWVGPDMSVRTGSWDQNVNFGLGAWSAPVVVAGPGSALPGGITAVARTPDHLEVFWVAPDQSVWTNWWDVNFNSGQWNVPFSISAPNAAMPGALSAVGRLPGHLDVFWVAPDGSVASNWWDATFNSGRWNTQFSIGGPNSALAPDFSVPPRAGSQVASRNVNQLDLMYVAFNGAVMRDFRSRFGGASAPDTAAPAGSAPAIGVPANTAPANGAVTVTSRQQNHLDVFWTAPNGSVVSTWADNFVNNGSWNASFAVAPAGSASPGSMVAAAAREPNQIDVFWVSPGGAVMTASWDAFFNNARWYTPFAVASAGSAQAGSPVAVATRQANQIDIFWVATTGAVMIASWNGFWTTPFAIAPAGSAPLGSPVSVVARQANQLDVFWVTKNGTVMTNWWNSNVRDGIWNTPFAVAPAGSAVAGSPLAVVAREANQLDVFWESPTRALMSNWWSLFANNGVWNTPYEIGTSESLEPGSPLAAIARQAGHIDVFWMAPGSIITGNSWDAFANNGQWSAPYAVLPAAPGSGGGGGGGGGGGIGPPCGGPKGPPCHQ